MRLASRADLQRLDEGETAEMTAALRGGGVALGDRSKLRELAQVRSYVGPHRSARTESQPVKLLTPAAARSARPDIRRLQETASGSTGAERGSGSMDTIALVLTAVLGIISVWTPQKASRDAEANAAAIERQTAARDKKEVKARQLLLCVQAQMSDFIVR